MNVRRLSALFALLLLPLAPAHAETPEAAFRRGNESASRARWDDAIREYGGLAQSGVRAPSLYWNWAQAALAAGRRGEGLWALMCAAELSPGDAGMMREKERLRSELGLDRSEISLGFLGELRLSARRFRFDEIAIAALLLSMVLAIGKRPRRALSLGAMAVGLLLGASYVVGSWREDRAVVVQKDAPLMDAPRSDAVTLASLREGEVVPVLGEEGDYVRIQDASGARGFAHKNEVRKIARE